MSREEQLLNYLDQESTFENFVSIYFRVSLFMSALCMMIGFILYSTETNTALDFSKMNVELIQGQIASFSPVGFMFLGLLLLLLIPFGRVIILLLHFLSKQDYLLMSVSLTVLLFMLIGIIFNVK
jgi:uncharacterized membrane protein